MNAITLTRRIDSAHLDLPELAPFIGKDVEIRIAESPSTSREEPDRWKALDAIMGRTDLIDLERIHAADAADRADAVRQSLVWQEINGGEEFDGTR